MRVKPFTNSKQEVRTRSVPTAAALILLGHEPVRVIYRDHGGSLLAFSPAAQDDFIRYISAKQRVDGLLEEADGAR